MEKMGRPPHNDAVKLQTMAEIAIKNPLMCMTAVARLIYQSSPDEHSEEGVIKRLCRKFKLHGSKLISDLKAQKCNAARSYHTVPSSSIWGQPLVTDIATLAIGLDVSHTRAASAAMASLGQFDASAVSAALAGVRQFDTSFASAALAGLEKFDVSAASAALAGLGQFDANAASAALAGVRQFDTSFASAALAGLEKFDVSAASAALEKFGQLGTFHDQHGLS